MELPTIQCWSPLYDIPPWACLWIQDVMNPVALQEPIFIVGRSPLANAATTAFLFSPIYAGSLNATADWLAANLRPDGLTNGGVAIPAKTTFAARPLVPGIHWLAYDADSDPDHCWFSPSGADWRLTSSESFVSGVNFRRVGYADRVQKCVPVVMEAVNWVHADIL